jgi:hypothetical protein
VLPHLAVRLLSSSGNRDKVARKGKVGGLPSHVRTARWVDSVCVWSRRVISPNESLGGFMGRAVCYRVESAETLMSLRCCEMSTLQG